MSEPLLLRENLGTAVRVTLNRPASRNALSRALVSELSDVLAEIEREGSARALILTGAGPVFCAGMDLKEAAADLDARATPEAETRAVQDAQAIADLINQAHRLPFLTIAALQGDALAGGAGLALACDVVLMSETARIGYPEVLRGLVAAIVLQDVARQVGDRRARELLLTGRLIDGKTAEQWGFVNRALPAGDVAEAALELAREAGNAAPRAVATTKRLLDEAAKRPKDLRGPAAISAATRLGDEAAEGLRAFLEKRSARWANSAHGSRESST